MSTPIRLHLDDVARFAADGETDGTIGLVVYTGSAVSRRGYYQDAKGRETYGDYSLRLSLETPHVRMGRLASGAAPLLQEHMQDVRAVLGRIVSAGLDASGLTARAQLSDAPGDADLVAKIRSGIVRNVSVGAFLHTIEAEDLESEPPRFVATDWEPFEVSAVAVGADPGAQVALALDLITPTPAAPAVTPTPEAPAQEPATMSTQTPAAPVVDLAARNKELRLAARLCGVTDSEQINAITDDVSLSLDAGRAQILALAAAREDARGIEGSKSAISMGVDETQKKLNTIHLALKARNDGTLLADSAAPYAREFRHMRLPDLARWCLRQRGLDDLAAGADSTVVSAALAMRSEAGTAAFLAGHSSSDLPYLLADSSRKELREGYNAEMVIHPLIARQRTLNDYLAHSHNMLGDTPDFTKLPENGSPTYGPLTESKGTVELEDWSAAVEIGRRMILADDLGALLTLPRRFGARARRKEHSIVCAVLTGGASGDWGDGNPLFSSAHGNISATTGAPSAATFAAHMLKMASQTGLVGSGQTADPLDIMPRFVIVPVALRTTAEQVLGAGYMPTAATSAVTDWMRDIRVVSTATLDAASATAWYTAADPALGMGLEYCYLAGESGVVVSSMPDWETEGVKLKARLAFAAHARDYRGLTYTAS